MLLLPWLITVKGLLVDREAAALVLLTELTMLAHQQHKLGV
jgi:hypothetical protein